MNGDDRRFDALVSAKPSHPEREYTELLQAIDQSLTMLDP
jgi:hypothetical protein